LCHQPEVTKPPSTEATEFKIHANVTLNVEMLAARKVTKTQLSSSQSTQNISPAQLHEKLLSVGTVSVFPIKLLCVQDDVIRAQLCPSVSNARTIWPLPPSSASSKQPSATQPRRLSKYGQLKAEDIY
jgi:hypothetical protein